MAGVPINGGPWLWPGPIPRVAPTNSTVGRRGFPWQPLTPHRRLTLAASALDFPTPRWRQPRHWPRDLQGHLRTPPAREKRDAKARVLHHPLYRLTALLAAPSRSWPETEDGDQWASLAVSPISPFARRRQRQVRRVSISQAVTRSVDHLTAVRQFRPPPQAGSTPTMHPGTLPR